MTTAIVIDDDIDTCDVLRELLELKDIQVLANGHNGKDAVDLYQKHNPDFVFLDVMMPYYDGLYGLEKIKQLNPTANVIAVTGDLSAETYNRLQMLKATAIIYKPFDIEKIMEIVKQVLTKKVRNIIRQERV